MVLLRAALYHEEELMTARLTVEVVVDGKATSLQLLVNSS